MVITKQLLAVNLLSYLQHKTSLDDLVAWAENSLMDEKINEDDIEVIGSILARIGVADVKTFGLTLEECDEIMKNLGYELKIDAGLVA
ncbi:MAG: hypothetical protein WCP08_07180 [Prolixibacteraceae bacterium]